MGKARLDVPLVAALAGLYLLALLQRTTLMLQGTIAYQRWGVDHLSYHAMAEGPWGEVGTAPFASRILVPALARVLPMDTQEAFLFQSVMFLWGAAVVGYLVLRRVLGSRTWAAAATALWLSLPWVTKYNLTNFWLTDPAVAFLTAVAVLAALAGRLGPFVATLVVGVMAKESMLFLAPLYASLNLGRRPWPVLAVGTAVAALSGLVVYTGLGILFREPGAYTLANAFAWNAPGRADLLLHDPLGFVGQMLVVPFSGLVLLAFLGGRQGRDWAVRFMPFLALTAAGILIASDHERVLAAAALPMVALMAMGARNLTGPQGAPALAFALAVAPAAALQLLVPTVPTVQLTLPWLAAGGLALLFVAAGHPWVRSLDSWIGRAIGEPAALPTGQAPSERGLGGSVAGILPRAGGPDQETPAS